jgi:preprotein translocase subunit Sss1
LCQPWIEILHRYGVTIILIGLIGFTIFSKIKPGLIAERDEH